MDHLATHMLSPADVSRAKHINFAGLADFGPELCRRRDVRFLFSNPVETPSPIGSRAKFGYDTAMYRAVTRQIEVTVEPNFLPDRSSAEPKPGRLES